MAVASAGAYASLHLALDRQPHQHPTTLFFTDWMPFPPPNQQRQITEGNLCYNGSHPLNFSKVRKASRARQKLLVGRILARRPYVGHPWFKYALTYVYFVFITTLSSTVLIDTFCAIVRGKKGFTSKRIVLFSNVCDEFGDDQLDDIIGSFKEAEIEFDVM